jgi:signal peptidase II
MLPKVSLGLQLGGAIGNLLDRIRYGYVVDFIQLGFWPVFNIADSCIVIGIILLSFILLRSGKSTPNQNSDPENYDSNPNTHPPDKT